MSPMSGEDGRFNWRQILGVRTADFYAMADWGLARKIGGALWLAGATIALLLFPLAPLDDSSLGDAGWIVGGTIIVLAYGVAVVLLRSGSRISPDGILALNYVAVVFIVVLMWLHGEFAPYTELLALPLIYTAAVHPPRRTLVFVLFTGLALLSPLLYAPEQSVAEELARFLLWSGLAIAATVFTAKVRIERQGLRALSDEARTEARLDPLTGLGNRRAFNEALAAATLRSSRTHTDLSVIIADLDSFKAINDRFGLPAGDRCLREVARVIDETVRQPDSSFRWGGDEFVVVADVDREGAAKLAERLKDAVRSSCRRPDGGPVTLHIGAAQLGDDGADPSALLAEASAALKATGESSTR
ncbi:MAG: GGDEF domain-containing protein [Solirubrobacterales bacterium]